MVREFRSGPGHAHDVARSSGGGNAAPLRPRTPEEQAAERVHRLAVSVDTALASAGTLASIVHRAAWRAERQRLEGAYTALAAEVVARAEDAGASEKAKENHDKAKAKVEELRAALDRAVEPRAVPPVAGEVEIEPQVQTKSIGADDLLAFAAGLAPGDRGRLKQRLGGGSPAREDAFARALVSALAGQRILGPFLGVLDDPRRFDRAAYERTRAGAASGEAEGPDAVEAATGEPAPAGAEESAAPASSEAIAAAEAGNPDALARFAPSGTGEPVPDAARPTVEAAAGDASGVRVHAGTEAAGLADRANAEAYAIGRDVVLGAGVDLGTPDGIGTLAHELTHTAQQETAGPSLQRRARDGSPETAAEREADRAAIAARTGASARGTPAASWIDAARERLTAPPDGPVTATVYLTQNRAALLPELRNVLAAEDWSQADRDHQLDVEVFLFRLHGALTSGDLVDNVRQAIQPASLVDLIDRNRLLVEETMLAGIDQEIRAGRVAPAVGYAGRTAADIGPRGPSSWSPSVGIALGAALAEQLRASLPRMFGRYGAVAREREGVEGAGPVKEADLIPSHPLDRFVARALASPGVVQRVPRGWGERAPVGESERSTGQLRPAQVEWQVGSMWNWVRVTSPADATSEEVAAAVLGDPAQAFRLIATPPLFGVPESLALHVPEMRAMHPQAMGGMLHETVNPSDASPALALSAVGPRGEEQALAEAARAGGHVPPDADALADLDLAQLRLEALVELLAPHGLAPYAMNGLLWVANRRAALGAEGGEPETWRAAARAQLRVTGELVGDVDALLSSIGQAHAETAGDGAQTSERAAAVAAAIPRAHRRALAAYAQVAAVTHLPETAAAMLAEARRLRTVSIAELLEDILTESVGAVESLQIDDGQHVVGGNEGWYTSHRLRQRQTELRMRVAKLRLDLLAGRGDPREIDALFREVDSLRVEATLVSQFAPVDAAMSALSEVEGNVWSNAFDVLSKPVDWIPQVGELTDQDPRKLLDTGYWLRGELRKMLAEWNAAQGALAAETDPLEIQIAQHKLEQIRRRLTALGERQEVHEFLTAAHDAVEDAGTKAAITQVAALIGISLVSAGAGGFARGLTVGRGGSAFAGQVANVTAATVTQTTLETLIMGGSFGTNLFDELVGNALSFWAVGAASKALRSNAKLAAALDQGFDGAGAYYLLAKGGELTLRSALVAGVQFVQMQQASLRDQGRTLTQEELTQEGIRGIAMILGLGVVEGIAKTGQRLERLGAKVGQARRLHAQARELHGLAHRLSTPDGADGALLLDVLQRHRRLIDAEAELYRSLHESGDIARDTRETLEAGADEHRGYLDTFESTGIAARASLDEVVPGRRYTGEPERIDAVVAHYQKAGYEVTTRGEGELTYVLRRGAHELGIVPRAAARDARSPTAEAADAAGGALSPAPESPGRRTVSDQEIDAELARYERDGYEFTTGRDQVGRTRYTVRKGDHQVELLRQGIQDEIDPRWLSYDQEDAARWQSHGLEDDPRGARLLEDPEFRRWYAQWMAMPERTVVRDGKVVVNLPEGVPETTAKQLQAVVEKGNVGLTTQALDVAERMRSKFPGVDLDVTSDSWRDARPRLVEEFGADAVARYERETTERTGAEGRQAVDWRIQELVDNKSLESLRRMYPNLGIYVTGSLTQPGKGLETITDVDVIVVMPDNTPPVVRAEFEATLRSKPLDTSATFQRELRASGRPVVTELPIDPKVMTQSQFLGWSMVPTPPGRTPMHDARIDTPLEGDAPGTGRSGFDPHNHMLGILPSEYFIEKAGGGSSVAALEQTWKVVNDPRFWKKDGTREVQGTVMAELGEAIADIRNLRDSGMPPAALEARARRAMDSALAASERVPFDHTYDLRDVLVKAFVDPSGSFENFAVDTMRGLADEGIGYSEQSVSLNKLEKKFDAETMERARERLAAEGKETDLRFLAMLPTSEVLSGKPMTPEARDRVAEALARGDVMGLDIAGPEAQAFTQGGMENLTQLLGLLREAGEARGRPLVLRPHVGEGYDAAKTGEHVEIARQNLQMVLDALVASGYRGPGDGVIIRFGHAAHATPEQLRVMKELGIIVEANVGSNLATGAVADPGQHPLLYNLYYGVTTTLGTDAQGVMQTTLAIEFQRAAQLIEQFRSGDTRLTIDGKLVAFDDLPPEVQRRFSIETLADWSAGYVDAVRAGDRYDRARAPRSERED